MDCFKVREVTLIWPITRIDGNSLFDSVCVSEDMPIVERHTKDYQWYKHFHPKVTTDSLFRRSNTVVLTFMIPTVRNDDKRTPLKAVFDFDSNTMRAKRTSSYAVSMTELAKMISIVTCLDIANNVKVTNIELSAVITERKPDLELLCDIVMNEPRLSNSFFLREKTIPVAMKVKYSVHTILGAVTFKRGDSKAITISSIKREEDIDAVVDQIVLLLDTYNEVEDEFSKLYDAVVEEKKTSVHRTRTFALKEEVPELFVSGYARECSIKPIIITESEEERYILEGRPTMRYPMDGPYSRIYACDVGLFPGLRRNRLSNKEMFEFLSCCYATDHLKRPESNYYKYLHNIFDATRSDKKIMRFKPLQPLEEGIIGKIPKALQEMTGSTDLIRVGVKRDKSSILHCMPFYVPRAQLVFPPQIRLHELWYLTEEEILANASVRIRLLHVLRDLSSPSS